MTTEEFIQKAHSIHGNKYDYSKVECKKWNIKVCIICPIHGEFWQDSSHHFRGHGCPKCCSTGIKSTTKEFIKKAQKIHGNKYDYSKIKYINNRTNVLIICPEHGEFKQLPCHHLKGSGCPKCRGRIATYIKAKESFVERAQKIHGGKYDYSKVEYEKANKKICIICPEHGEFWQTPAIHLQGTGCQHCSNDKKLNVTSFIKKAEKIHTNKYDYSNINCVDRTKPLSIICPIHGEFKQKPYSHLYGHGCPKCAIEKTKFTTEEFVKKARLIHGNKYDYSKSVYIGCDDKVCIICPEHGEFWQKPRSHLRGNGCWLCSESHGEREIRQWLDRHEIEYVREKEFGGLVGVGGNSLRFDFYLPKHNACIEFDGRQHKEWIRGMMTKRQFLSLQEHDKRKNEFCFKNGIKLVRIWKDDENNFHKCII